MISLLMALAITAEHPTYLRCIIQPQGTEVLITADEANSAVTVALPSTGHSEKMAAAFTATDVRFQNRQVAYVVSRTDLSIDRTIKLINSTDHGKCTVEQAPKRAF
jgi:hypothetical protein